MTSFSALISSIILLPAAQFIMRNLQISNEDLSKEPSISREELISKEQIVIKSSRRPQNQNPKLPLSTLKEKHLRNAALESEETTEDTPSAGRS